MASRRNKMLAGATATVLAAGGYFSIPCWPSRGRHAAQAPLRAGADSATFLMAVDDSGSMTFETLFPGRMAMAAERTSSSTRMAASELAALRIQSCPPAPRPGSTRGVRDRACRHLRFARYGQVNPSYSARARCTSPGEPGQHAVRIQSAASQGNASVTARGPIRVPLRPRYMTVPRRKRHKRVVPSAQRHVLPAGTSTGRRDPAVGLVRLPQRRAVWVTLPTAPPSTRPATSGSSLSRCSTSRRMHPCQPASGPTS